jgi:hypothetical protein
MKAFLLVFLIACSIPAFSQDTLRTEQEEPEKTRGFQKDQEECFHKVILE